MSRFTRPAFTAPKVPKPPKALATILPIIARVTALLPVVMAIRSVGIQSFLINGALAQAKSRIPELKQRLLKSKIVASAFGGLGTLGAVKAGRVKRDT